ncbi:YeeE/YedE family protein [Methylomonas rivi]|uniref:YeeE/YedE family protein n=1 Tax=Methylomonas rivi TaxID=2952226 RepID=A0ABT1U609_9GAMM|nr:YeeE/YedE family protein [Methylomonas sp. WSC-6]MCQ8128943.1 YeeE/YedE family protein [Methylomonas sp. WSC-6]
MQNFTPVSALLGGALIGLSAFILLWFNGRIAGISSIMNGLFAASGPNRYWRLAFLLGLMLGAAIWQQFAPAMPTLRPHYPLPLIIVGGFLVGFGTRLGSGCTSGHGICGIALLSPRSIAATLTFMASGIATVYLLRHVLQVSV